MPVCPQCKKAFEQPRQRGPKRTFCSPECTYLHNKRKGRVRSNRVEAKVVISFTCRHCGVAVTRPGRRGRTPTYCTATCRTRANIEARLPPREPRPCATCGKAFSATPTRLYCSKVCCVRKRKDATCQRCGVAMRVAGSSKGAHCPPCRQALGHAAQEANLAAEVRACRECGAGYTPRRAAQAFCSEACSERMQSRLKRARANRALVDADISLAGVFERDGGLCGVCGLPVDPALPARHVGSATIDHVFPVVRGGLHSWENVQLAHYGCNSSKGDRLAETVTGR